VEPKSIKRWPNQIVIIRGKPPALPGDSQSLTDTGVIFMCAAPGTDGGRMWFRGHTYGPGERACQRKKSRMAEGVAKSGTGPVDQVVRRAACSLAQREGPRSRQAKQEEGLSTGPD